MIRRFLSKTNLTEEQLALISDEHIERIDHLIKENDLETAIQLTNRFQKKYPHNKRGICNSAIAISYGGRPDAASRILDQSIKDNPNEPILIGNLGAAYFRSGHLELALDYARKSFELDPTSANAVKLLADTLCDLNEHQQARDACIDFLQSNEPNYMIWFKAGVCEMGLEQYQSAAESFRQAIQLDEHGDSPAHANLAGALIGMKEYDEAETILLKVLEAHPDDGITLCNLALVYESKDLNQEAHDLYQRSTEVDPDYERAYWELDRLKELLKLDH